MPSFARFPRCFGPPNGTGGKAGQVNRAERKLGPFKVEERAFSVVLRIKKIEGAPDGFGETVESFSIVDERGEEHVRKAFKVEVGNGMFEETVGIAACVLESAGKKILRSERGAWKG